MSEVHAALNDIRAALQKCKRDLTIRFGVMIVGLVVVLVSVRFLSH